MDDELGIHLGNEPEFALANLGWVMKQLHICWMSAKGLPFRGFEARGCTTCPETSGLLGHEPDVLRTLLHLAGQIQGCCYDEKWIRSANLDLGIEAFYIDLGCGHGLLSGSQSFSEAVDFYTRSTLLLAQVRFVYKTLIPRQITLTLIEEDV